MSDAPFLDCIDAILRPGGISVLFQPILECRREGGYSLFALEGLTRGPRGTSMEQADAMFSLVRLLRDESLVDRTCVRAVLTEAVALPGSPKLSINVHTSTLVADLGFPQFLGDLAQELSIPTTRLIVEILEHAPYRTGRSLIQGLERLRDMGVEIALDDVGVGYSNYQMILDCRPSYFKIDGHFIHRCDQDRFRRAILESVSRLAGSFRARLIAEHVELSAELEVVTAMGFDLFQGYFFCPPLASAQLSERLMVAGPLDWAAPEPAAESDNAGA